MNALARQISVILVDDHPVVRAGYRRLLTRADDIDVVGEAADGESGYRLFQKFLPDVTILDLTLPGMSGLEVLRRIHMREPEAGVLIFSIHENEMIMARAISLGAWLSDEKLPAQSLMLDACRQVAAAKPISIRNLAARLRFRQPQVSIRRRTSLRESFRYFLLWLKGLQCPLSPNASVLAQRLWVCITQV